MFRILWQVWIVEIGKKITKMLKEKKQLVNSGIDEEFWISNVYIFLKNIRWFFKILW